MKRFRRRLILLLVGAVAFVAFVSLPLVFPADTASAVGPCDLSADLAPEMVGGGIDGLVMPPAPDAASGASSGAASVADGGVGSGGAGTGGAAAEPKEPLTNYQRYGMAGQFWHTYGLGCSDLTAVLGNAWANTVFSWAKAVDRLTISTYEAAATEGPLQPIKEAADEIVTNLADAMYWPYLRPIVILGAVWLAWYGLIRRRATTTTEGVVWMVLAVTVAVWFFSRPGDFTGIGKTVTDKTGEIVNSAFSGLPGAGGASCLPLKEDTGAGADAGGTPVEGTAAEVKAGGYGRPGTPGVAQNADALWSTLVCKPWLMGEFGTADPNAPVVRDFGAKLLGLQAIDADEQAANQMPSSDVHQKRFEEEIVKPLENTPVFFLLQGKDWTSRLGIAIGAFIAAMVAGLLIFLVAVSLLVLKVGFLLLLMLGPVFLLIGVHPGSGRIIAMRWVEMVVGTLLRQAVLALALGVLVYGYALIISTNLPWGMQILFMALLTIAVFFYRRPFQHLFSSMDGHTLTTRMLGEAATAPTLSRAANVLPPVATARVGRWGLRKAEPLIGAAAMAAGAGAAGAAAASVAQGRVRGEAGAPGQTTAQTTGQTTGQAAAQTAAQTAGQAAEQVGARAGAQPAPLDTDAQAAGRRRAGAAPRPGSAPPLNLTGVRPAGSRAPSGGSSAPPAPGGRSGSGTGPGSGTGSRGGGWFSGRSGGWASPKSSRSSSSSRSSGSSSSGSRRGSGGGIFGGGSGGGSGGGIFGGGSRDRGAARGPRSAGDGGSSSGGSSSGRSRPRSSDAPPLWLPSRGSGGRTPDDAPTPFWARPSDRDSGD